MKSALALGCPPKVSKVGWGEHFKHPNCTSEPQFFGIWMTHLPSNCKSQCTSKSYCFPSFTSVFFCPVCSFWCWNNNKKKMSVSQDTFEFFFSRVIATLLLVEHQCIKTIQIVCILLECCCKCSSVSECEPRKMQPRFLNLCEFMHWCSTCASQRDVVSETRSDISFSFSLFTILAFGQCCNRFSYFFIHFFYPFY